jgi:hypothetical protein
MLGIKSACARTFTGCSWTKRRDLNCVPWRIIKNTIDKAFIFKATKPPKRNLLQSGSKAYQNPAVVYYIEVCRHTYCRAMVSVPVLWRLNRVSAGFYTQMKWPCTPSCCKLALQVLKLSVSHKHQLTVISWTRLALLSHREGVLLCSQLSLWVCKS